MNLVRARAATCFALMFGASALLTGCPGEMTPEDKEFFESMYGNRGGGAGTGGSGGSGNAGTGGTVAGCDAPTLVFNKMQNGTLAVGACALSSCHDATTAQSGLDLSVADPFPAMLNKPTDKTGPGSACMNDPGLIIDANNPAASLLYTKITDGEPSCGLKMPFPVGPQDNGASAMCVLQWIEAKLDAQ